MSPTPGALPPDPERGLLLRPSPGRQLLGVGLALILVLPVVALAPGSQAIIVAVVLSACVVVWTTRERAWIGASGIEIRMMPWMRPRWVDWSEVADLVLPARAWPWHGPWLKLHDGTRVTLPFFVNSSGFGDALARVAPDVLDRHPRTPLDTTDPPGRFVDGVWVCAAHNHAWCHRCHRPDEGRHAA